MKFSTPSLLALAAPLASTLVGASPLVSVPEHHQLERRVATSAPHFVAYWDNWLSGENGPPSVSTVSGYNNLILAFLLASGSVDQAQEWTLIDAATRSATHSAYAAAGVNILVSAFGSTEAPTSAGYAAASTATTMANWVITYGLDGIDVDYEDFNAINAANGSAESWLITFTQTLRNLLPAGQYIITHAPVAPWFSPIYTAGAYTKVHAQVGSLIDWYNVQFYNQGTTEYTTCAGLLTASSSTWPDTAVFQIASTAGVPLSKIVIGKPGTTSDASNGYVDPGTLATCLQQGKASGWTGGAMVWEFPDVGSAWITTVREDSWPVGSVITNPTTTVSTPTSTSSAASKTTTAVSSGSCSGVSAWSSAVAYTGGQQVTYGGYLWTASYWTEDSVPGGAAGVWVQGAAC